MLPKLALDHVTGCATHNCPQRTKFFGLDWMSKTTLRIYIYFEFRASGGKQEKKSYAQWTRDFMSVYPSSSHRLWDTNAGKWSTTKIMLLSSGYFFKVAKSALCAKCCGGHRQRSYSCWVLSCRFYSHLSGRYNDWRGSFYIIYLQSLV